MNSVAQDTNQFLLIEPRDPLIARDGRPFSPSQRRMRPLDWPYPSTAAGSLRTVLGKDRPDGFSSETIRELKDISVAGPLPWSSGALFVPAPNDIVCDASGRCFGLRPASYVEGEKGDLPDGLTPVMLPDAAGSEVKFSDPPDWWAIRKLTDWLVTTGGPPSRFFEDRLAFRESPAKDARTQREIDPATLANKEGMLFQSVGLVLDELRDGQGNRRATTEPDVLALRVSCMNSFQKQIGDLDHVHPFGGERRVVRWRRASTTSLAEAWTCPVAARAALAGSKRVRMVLVSSAIFDHGWRPGWLRWRGTDSGRSWVGNPPESPIELRLVGLCNRRWKAVSGWSLESPRGPKPIRRLTPAGAVFFFEVAEGQDAARLADRWLEPVSDAAADRRDGFGLAAWGVW